MKNKIVLFSREITTFISVGGPAGCLKISLDLLCSCYSKNLTSNKFDKSWTKFLPNETELVKTEANYEKKTKQSKEIQPYGIRHLLLSNYNICENQM